jgi:hypothetical protein
VSKPASWPWVLGLLVSALHPHLLPHFSGSGLALPLSQTLTVFKLVHTFSQRPEVGMTQGRLC